VPKQKADVALWVRGTRGLHRSAWSHVSESRNAEYCW